MADGAGASQPASAPVEATRGVRQHRRFALTDVTVDGMSVGGATVDTWVTASGESVWATRILMRVADGHAEAAITGRTRDGRELRGRVTVSTRSAGPGARGMELVEWHGVGPLVIDSPED